MRNLCRDRGHVVVLVGFFVLSRIVLGWLGATLDAKPLNFYWQFADPELLHHDLLQTIFYLHSQPPFFNLFLGVVLKLFPVSHVSVFHLCYMALGLLRALCVFGLLRRLTVGKTLALVFTCLFVVSPPIIRYEKLLFYEHVSACLLTFTAYLFVEYVATKRPRTAIATICAASMLGLTLNAFHWAWVSAVTATLLLLARGHRKTVALGAVVPLGLLFGFHLKNLMVFGKFSLTTWFVAANLPMGTVHQLPSSLRSSLVKHGQLSRIALVHPFAEPDKYLEVMPVDLTGIPVLDNVHKSTGAGNRHHMVYFKISDDLSKDAHWVLRNFPQYYFDYFFANLRRALTVSSDDAWGIPVFPRLDGTFRRFNALIFGPADGRFLLTAGLVFGLLYGLWTTYRGLRDRVAPVVTAACGFLAVNVAGLNSAMILLAPDDQQRYRSRTDTLSFLLAVFLLVRLARYLNGKWTQGEFRRALRLADRLASAPARARLGGGIASDESRWKEST
jgi:hypothetical protein